MHAQKIHDKIIELQKASSYGLLEIGQLLYQLEQERGWEALNFENFMALVTADEDAGGLEMEMDDASKLKGVYQHYVVGEIATMEQLRELGGTPYKFYEARKLVKTPQDLEMLRLPLKEIRKIGKQENKTLEELAKCEHLNFLHYCPDCKEYLKEDPREKRFYRIWVGAKNRCNNPKNEAYKYYGGRGIKFCERWNDFKNFREDMYVSYLDHLAKFGIKETTIDRIDNDRNYELNNCRWATIKEQIDNRSCGRHKFKRENPLLR